eukprot:NODE_7879_length_1542_cov_3.906007.p3 GENE.NODE_7879_length_1542_cov_3.906007~~NODE_7879_length_1542_cov_3.906007.p3  ORF type:complete len:110 (+),score=60.39 NODE_7879_length_1542_cov_3.906007:1139-1468(+)
MCSRAGRSNAKCGEFDTTSPEVACWQHGRRLPIAVRGAAPLSVGGIAGRSVVRANAASAGIACGGCVVDGSAWLDSVGSKKKKKKKKKKNKTKKKNTAKKKKKTTNKKK